MKKFTNVDCEQKVQLSSLMVPCQPNHMWLESIAGHYISDVCCGHHRTFVITSGARITKSLCRPLMRENYLLTLRATGKGGHEDDKEDEVNTQIHFVGSLPFE